MATITYQVLRKPIEQRIIDAGCVYYDVEREYFFKTEEKEDSTVVQRRSILSYLIKHSTNYSLKEIAGLFGFTSHSAIHAAIEKIEAQKKVLRQVSDDLNQISFLADKLDADIITTSIQLVNNKFIKN